MRRNQRRRNPRRRTWEELEEEEEDATTNQHIGGGGIRGGIMSVISWPISRLVIPVFGNLFFGQKKHSCQDS